MLELPESYTMAKQMNEAVTGKTIKSVIAGQSPHKFCWFYGDETQYDAMMSGRTINNTQHYGGWVEMELDGLRLNFHDGVNMQLFAAGAKHPPKHQLLIGLDDGSALISRVQMYGGISLFEEGTMDNPYYTAAVQTENPFTPGFTAAYFEQLLGSIDPKKTSAKAFLATEQRIPGLGNGILQDILWTAHIHPKTKIQALNDAELETMYHAVCDISKKMAEQNGRDTEKDLYGNAGGYQTVMSKNNKEAICPACGAGVKRDAYMGGNVYYCTQCQIKK